MKKIVIAGGGLMGASIGQSFPQYGFETTIYCRSEEHLKKAKEIVAECQKTLVDNRIITEAKSQEIQSALVYSIDKKCFADATWVIEAISEDIDSKRKFFEELNGIVPDDALITSNTSAISINVLSRAVRNSERFCGTHWLNPPHIIPLVEITKSETTSEQTVKRVYDLLLSLEKQPVVLNKDIKGFLSNRLQFALLREATYLVETGVATPEDIDRTLKYGNGLRYLCSGPFKIIDFGGIPVFNTVAQYLYPDLNCEKEKNYLLQSLVDKNCNGVSNHKGFYQYPGTLAVEEEKERDRKMLMVLSLK
jgi:3-hydroxybutyryl-CoA dehydrogenase